MRRGAARRSSTSGRDAPVLFGTCAVCAIRYSRIVNMFWIVMSAAIVVALAKRIGPSRVAAKTSDLGSVSNRWISEHRLVETSDHG